MIFWAFTTRMPIVFLFVTIDIRVVKIAKNHLARAAAAVPIAVLRTGPGMTELTKKKITTQLYIIRVVSTLRKYGFHCVNLTGFTRSPMILLQEMTNHPTRWCGSQTTTTSFRSRRCGSCSCRPRVSRARFRTTNDEVE